MAHSKIAGAVTKHTSEGTLYPTLQKTESERYIMITNLERDI
jgi:DNA-binding PadR family transcriptional regulator